MSESSRDLSSTSFLDLLAGVPQLIDNYLLPTEEGDKRVIELRLVSRDARVLFTKSITFFRTRLGRTDHNSFSGFIQCARPHTWRCQLDIVNPDWMKSLLASLGETVLSGIHRLVIASQDSDDENTQASSVEQSQQWRDTNRALVPILLAALPHLQELVLFGSSLFTPHILSSLSSMQHLFCLGVSLESDLLAPHLQCILLSLDGCHNLQELRLLMAPNHQITAAAVLPPCVTNLELRGSVRRKLIKRGFFGKLCTLSVSELEHPFNDLNKLLKVAPRLEQLIITSAQSRIKMYSHDWLHKGFALSAPCIHLSGSITSIHNQLQGISIAGVVSCSMSISQYDQEKALDLDSEPSCSFFALFASKCPSVEVLDIYITNEPRSGLYSRTGKFITSLHTCSKLQQLSIDIWLPEPTSEQLSEMLLSLPPSLKLFKTVSCILVNGANSNVREVKRSHMFDKGLMEAAMKNTGPRFQIEPMLWQNEAVGGVEG